MHHPHGFGQLWSFESMIVFYALIDGLLQKALSEELAFLKMQFAS